MPTIPAKSDAQIKAEEHQKMRNESIKLHLENAPLHKRLNLGVDLDKTVLLPLQLKCKSCKLETTHSYEESKSDLKFSQISFAKTRSAAQVYQSENATYKFTFKCQRCESDFHYFLVTFFNKQMFKTGQYPAKDINVASNIEQKLGPELSIHYTKGKISVSNGFGIAAMAYYRRVIEDKVKAILNEIESIVPEEDKAKYLEAIRGVSDLHSFEAKAEIIYEAMPVILRPRGNNYLKFLFSKVSEGLHSKSDEECLDIAVNVSQLLEVIIHILNQQSEAEKVIEKLGKSLKS